MGLQDKVGSGGQDSTGSKEAKGQAYGVLGGQGLDLQGPRGLGGGQKGPKEARGRPVASQGVDGLAYRVPGGQGAGLQGPKRSRGMP